MRYVIAGKTNKTKKEYLVLRKKMSIYKNNLSSNLTDECHYYILFFLMV